MPVDDSTVDRSRLRRKSLFKLSALENPDTLPENDDEAERQERRRQRESVANLGDESLSVGGSRNITTTDVMPHCANSIKLPNDNEASVTVPDAVTCVTVPDAVTEDQINIKDLKAAKCDIPIDKECIQLDDEDELSPRKRKVTEKEPTMSEPSSKGVLPAKRRKSVSDHSDPSTSSKSILKEKAELFFKKNRLQKFTEGDRVWARLGRYPYWPAVVIRDPNSGMYIKTGSAPSQVHVRFYCDQGRRAWVPYYNVLEFKVCISLDELKSILATEPMERAMIMPDAVFGETLGSSNAHRPRPNNPENFKLELEAGHESLNIAMIVF